MLKKDLLMSIIDKYTKYELLTKQTYILEADECKIKDLIQLLTTKGQKIRFYNDNFSDYG